MATLKISDLSVGDWVLMNGEPAKALRLTMAGRTIFKGLSGQIYGSVGGDIFPLPIVPEILEANGFEKIRENVYFDSYCWTNKKDTMIEVSHYKETYNVKIVQLVDGLQKDRFCNLDILFVHQLQHILRLAGVDKEIVMLNK